MPTHDPRVPIRFAPLGARVDMEAVLTDMALDPEPPMAAFKPATGWRGHRLGCRCCVPRNGAALALAQLFRARATGQGAWFHGILAVTSPAGRAAIEAALKDDVLVAARFRLAAGTLTTSGPAAVG